MSTLIIMTENDPEEIQRRTVLKVTSAAAASAAGIGGITGLAAAQETDEFTVTSKRGGAQRTSGDIEVTDIDDPLEAEDVTVDLERLKFESVDTENESAVVTANGIVETPEGTETFQNTDEVDLVLESVSSASAQQSGVGIFQQQGGNQCPERSQRELITLTVEDLILNLLGIVIAVNDVDIAVCCDPDFTIGQLLCELLRTD